jgi:hypothetical protein
MAMQTLNAASESFSGGAQDGGLSCSRVHRPASPVIDRQPTPTQPQGIPCADDRATAGENECGQPDSTGRPAGFEIGPVNWQGAP